MDAKEPHLDSPEVIDLSSSTDDEDDDAELKRAIALSLEEQTTAGKAKPRPSMPLNRDQNPKSPCMATFGSLLLDRKTMEFERQQRLKRKRDGSSPPAREPPRPASKANLSSLPNNPLESAPQKTSTTIREANTISSRSILPFPTGTVKRTWTHGQERRGDDIKIEEVFQRSELKLAVLASFQWDDDWLLSKINLSQTRLICVAFARDEAHKDQMRANVPSNRIRFCFPSMNGGGAMHAKIQLLKFSSYLRIVVPSGNLTRHDWGETGVLENIVFIIDLPRLETDGSFEPTLFSQELFRFLGALGLDENLVRSLENYDFTATKRYGFVHTICGSHVKDDWKYTGYCGLGRVVDQLGLSHHGPVDVDFVCSSLGNLKPAYISALYAAFQGKSAEALLTGTNGDKNSSGGDKTADSHFRVYFPSQKTVLESRGGTAVRLLARFSCRLPTGDAFSLILILSPARYRLRVRFVSRKPGGIHLPFLVNS